ncbi:brachyurin-like [Cylas formicarius]|uniref:brachyurin-like n=1 Tax=Cylas formicarius TaxID=197179 RepID=UPI00295888D2|nr:brachyurin-like [Cylas formicarius]
MLFALLSINVGKMSLRVVVIAVLSISALSVGKDVSMRVIGGQNATGPIPYQAFVEFTAENGTSWPCGGSLIAARYVLTSATCTYAATKASVILGAFDLNDQSENTRQTFNVSSIIPHQEYNEDVLLNDVALLQLDSSAVINDAVQVIPLADASQADDTLQDQIAAVSGWGKTSPFQEGYSTYLLNGSVPIIDVRICETAYYDLVRRDRHLCSRNVDESVSMCDGDFGGPLVINGTLYGVQSFNIAGCYVGFPSVYSKITFYLDWIEENILVNL